MTHILNGLFGDTLKVDVLEELCEHWDEPLTTKEIARMIDAEEELVKGAITYFRKIGLVVLIISESHDPRFKLNSKDKRALLLSLLESEQYLYNIKDV